MKKAYLVLILMALSACNTGCYTTIKNVYNDTRGDADAEYIQPLMRTAVKVEDTLKVKFTPNDVFASVSEGQETEVKQSGSGVVVAVSKRKGTSAILTAWHVCDTYEKGFKVNNLFGTLEVVEGVQNVITIEDKKIPVSKYLYRNKDRDVCLLEVKYEFDGAAKIATSMPPRGAYVDIVGSPMGIWDEYLVSSQSGRYFGTTDIEIIMGRDDKEPTKLKNFAYYGFAGVGGYSGSGIFYRGKLVGLLSAGSTRYEHAAYGPTFKDLQIALKVSDY